MNEDGSGVLIRAGVEEREEISTIRNDATEHGTRYMRNWHS